jgi:nitrate reductase delta subunit
MAQTFKVLSALLSYPTEELQEAADEAVRRALGRSAVTEATQADVDRLIVDLAAGDLTHCRSASVELFDRGRSLSLYLFEHVHGESRDRGQAMIDLESAV